MLVAIAAFAAAAALIVLLPGPDTLVVIRGILRGGRRRGVATSAGNLVGLSVWVTAAVLGLSAVLQASRTGYDVLRLAGAVYLLWLGVQSLRSRSLVSPVELADGPDGAGLAAADGAAGRGGLRSGFGAGLVTNLLNPKVGVFFITFLPGFVPHGASVPRTTLIFGAIFVVETAAYWVVLLSVAARVTDWMARPRVRRRLDALTGAVLIGFGIRLAVES